MVLCLNIVVLENIWFELIFSADTQMALIFLNVIIKIQEVDKPAIITIVSAESCEIFFIV